MSDPALREQIVAELRKHQAEHDLEWPGFPKAYFGYCTWWFKHRISCTTKEARRELERMKREGLVTSDHRQSNNTKWKLVQPTPTTPTGDER